MARNQAGDAEGSTPTGDQFDNPPRGPVGVHRGSRPLAVRLMPFIVVILVAALCGFLAWAYVSGSRMPWQQAGPASSVQSSKEGTASPSASPTGQASTQEGDGAGQSAGGDQESASPEQSGQPQDGQTQSQQPAPPASTVNKATQIRVVNGTRISGYAASKRQVLVNSGYSAVTASNPAGQLPPDSTVLYRDEADKATAEDVARVLGIASVQQSAATAAPVEAILLR